MADDLSRSQVWADQRSANFTSRAEYCEPSCVNGESALGISSFLALLHGIASHKSHAFLFVECRLRACRLHPCAGGLFWVQYMYVQC